MGIGEALQSLRGEIVGPVWPDKLIHKMGKIGLFRKRLVSKYRATLQLPGGEHWR
jgi:hypothetical protein